MSRVCELTGAKANNGMAVSHSHIRTKKLQQVNLQKRRLWWSEGKKWINIRISTKALKTIQKVGLNNFAKIKSKFTERNIYYNFLFIYIFIPFTIICF